MGASYVIGEVAARGCSAFGVPAQTGSGPSPDEVADYAGLLPVVGDAADVLHAATYAARGQWNDAGIASTSVVPFVGSAGVAYKYGRKTAKATNGAARPAPAIVRGGETAATRDGREIHKTFDYGPGFRREFRLPSGRRADAVNLRTRELVELKPNNPRATAQGRRQLDAYARELEELYPGAPFTRRLETYDRP